MDADAGDEHGGLAPVASRGVFLIGALTLSSEVREATWQRAHTPEQAVELLADANPGVLHDDLVDVVAYLWLEGIDSAALDALATLYQRNCAACHGETGGGDGPAADLTIEQPVAFSDAAHMFTRRGDVLYAKIRRGGMGTDMPNFGTLFTPEETWGLVEYLWTLAFVQDGPP
jgi:mono/diheme cytochrome c family protein